MVNLEIIKDSIYLRIYQSALAALIKKKPPQNPVHLALGHEVSTMAYLYSLEKDHAFCLTHRNMHFNLGLAIKSKTKNLDKLLKEICGYSDGAAKGNLGSMNLSHKSLGTIYSSSILANSLGVATGAAMAFKNEQSDKRVTVTLGDGSVEEGRFWETLTVISKYDLPLDVYIEDNGWSMQSSLFQRRNDFDFSLLASTFDLDYININFSQNYDLGTVSSSFKSFSVGPRLIVIKVDTLGGKWLKENNNKRYINYHSGTLINEGFDLDNSFGFSISESDLLTKDICEEFIGLKKAKEIYQMTLHNLFESN